MVVSRLFNVDGYLNDGLIRTTNDLYKETITLEYTSHEEARMVRDLFNLKSEERTDNIDNGHKNVKLMK